MLFLPVLLYAEIHYRFKYFFNLLSRRQPEIVADVPRRVPVGQPVPVLIVIKDAHLYPVTFRKITVIIDKQQSFEKDFEQPFTSPYDDCFLEIPPEYFSPGDHQIDVRLEYQIKNKTLICYNDNYRGTSHAPLEIHIAAQPFPGFDKYFMGDLHVHSSYTSDQIEFGASPAATTKMAQSMGLHFIALTDHSYDLDDAPDDYLKNDPDLTKWRRFKAEVADLNTQWDNNFCIVPGEEVSVRNSETRNIHLLVFNHSEFLPGSGDSGENWFRFHSEHTLTETLEQLEDGALAFGAHPAAKTPWLQKWFIYRGDWTGADLRAERLTGLKFFNGADDAENERGLQLWKKLLLEGKKIFILAGNDAHGNFSRTRQIGIPFVMLEENRQHLLGNWRTGLFIGNGSLHPKEIMRGLKSGNYFVTDGPAVKLCALRKGERFTMGTTCPLPDFLEIEAVSSHEFGGLTKLTVWAGLVNSKSERKVWQRNFKNDMYRFTGQIPLQIHEPVLYFRAEAESVGRQAHHGYTNPIWVT